MKRYMTEPELWLEFEYMLKTMRVMPPRVDINGELYDVSCEGLCAMIDSAFNSGLTGAAVTDKMLGRIYKETFTYGYGLCPRYLEPPVAALPRVKWCRKFYRDSLKEGK
jgi:hypothetical protein